MNLIDQRTPSMDELRALDHALMRLDSETVLLGVDVPEGETARAGESGELRTGRRNETSESILPGLTESEGAACFGPSFLASSAESGVEDSL